MILDTFDYTYRTDQEGNIYTLHKYCLDRLNIVCDNGTQEEYGKALLKTPWVTECNQEYDPNVFEVVRGALQSNGGCVPVDGYAGDYRYHESVIEDLRQELNPLIPPKDWDDETRGVMARIALSESVSLHIRRTDYVTNPLCLNLNGDYYRDALQYIGERKSNLRLFVFCDDLEWARHTRWPFPAELVCKEGVGPADRNVEDLMVMAACRNHVIANSSYSFWGARLAVGAGITVAPKVYHRPDDPSLLATFGKVVQPTYPHGWVAL